VRNHRRHGNVRPVVVKGKKAQGWEWIGDPVLVSSSAPPPEGQVDQRAGV